VVLVSERAELGDGWAAHNRDSENGWTPLAIGTTAERYDVVDPLGIAITDGDRCSTRRTARRAGYVRVRALAVDVDMSRAPAFGDRFADLLRFALGTV